ncbi:MAG: sterol carrier protein domain-containing protein [Pirellulales bacterium]
MIESDRQEISVATAPGNDIERYLIDALPNAGNLEEQTVLMLKTPDPARFFEAMKQELLVRRASSGLGTHVELGFSIDGAKHLLSVTRDAVKWTSGKLGRQFLELRNTEFTRLITGHCDLSAAIDAGRVHASNRAAAETAAGLFPKAAWWTRPWDDITV